MSKVRLALILTAVVTTLLVGVLVGLFLTRYLPLGPAKSPIPTTAVVRQIQTLSQLVTVRYVIEKVVVEEDVKWFGENRVLLVAHGVVKAGVDLDHLRPEDVEVSGGTVRVKLPPPQITDTYLDEQKTQVVERSTGLLRLFDKNLETVARQNAVDDIRRAARNEGILKDAEERARLQLESLLLRMGFDQVEVSAN